MKNILSVIFVLLLNLPTVVNLEHFFDDSHHEVCTESSEHFHEKESVCVSCEFIRNLHDINFNKVGFSFVNIQLNFLDVSIKKLIFYSQYFLSTHSRGPPNVAYI